MIVQTLTIVAMLTVALAGMPLPTPMLDPSFLDEIKKSGYVERAQ